MSEDHTLTVTELADTVGAAIIRALPEPVWVRGEIRDLSRHEASGHVYFTLVDPDDDRPAAARLPVTLFSSDKDAINWKLKRSGAGRMTDGTEVRIFGVVSHYASRGTVQFRMTWIDPEFTLGRLAAQREAMVRRLADEGLLDRNRSLPMPAVPLRVGLVTSVGSAAYADFLHELGAGGFSWNIVVHDARVQGSGAPASLVTAIRSLEKMVDVIALVRGGGAQTELAAFDDEDVARAIALCLVPVVTGIGHEVDVVVADRVAHASYKTPTAAAAGLVGIVRRAGEHLGSLSQRIEQAASRALHRSRLGVEQVAGRINRETRRALRSSNRTMDRAAVRITDRSARPAVAAARRLRGLEARLQRTGVVHVSRASARLDHGRLQVARASVGALERAVHRLNLVVANLAAADPERLKQRGFAIMRDASGRVVSSVARLSPGDVVEVEVADGAVDATVGLIRHDIAHRDRSGGESQETASQNESQQ
jgi:exodeoxyribonuclease VII large subunit